MRPASAQSAQRQGKPKHKQKTRKGGEQTCACWDDKPQNEARHVLSGTGTAVANRLGGVLSSLSPFAALGVSILLPTVTLVVQATASKCWWGARKQNQPSKLLTPREILVTLPASVDTPYKKDRSASNSLSQPSLHAHRGPSVDSYRRCNAHFSCLCGLERGNATG